MPPRHETDLAIGLFARRAHDARVVEDAGRGPVSEIMMAERTGIPVTRVLLPAVASQVIAGALCQLRVDDVRAPAERGYGQVKRRPAEEAKRYGSSP